MGRRLTSPAILQISAVVIGFAALALAPPASGRMLLVPLDRAAAAELVPLVLDHGGLLVGAGPLPRSYVVYGERSRLAVSLIRDGILTLAAPRGGCGDAQEPA